MRLSGGAIWLVAAGAGFALLLAQACAFDWDAFDPRLEVSGAGASAGDGGGGAGTGGTGAGGAPVGGSGGSGGGAPCGTTVMLADDFADGSIDGAWELNADAGVTLEESGGTRAIVLPAMSSTWSAFDTVRLYDLRSSAISLEVIEMVDETSTAAAFLTVAFSSESYASITQQGGSLLLAISIEGQWNQVFAPYEPTQHRFWQIREAGGDVYWETSADGSQWATGRTQSVDMLFPVDLLQVEIGAFTEGREASPGTFRFDNLNGGQSSSAGWCPLESLSDDFEDDDLGRIWWRSWDDGTCSNVEQGGTMSIEFTAAGDCGIVSAQAFDAAGAAATVEVASPGASGSAYSYLGLERDSDNKLGIDFSDGYLSCSTVIGGARRTLGETSYSAVDHRFWKLREAGGTLYCETSPDGIRWTAFASGPMPIDPRALDVVLGAGSTTAVSGAVVFDNFNLLP